MKQVREVRTFEARHSITSWFSPKDHIEEPIRCICVHTMTKFWHINRKEKIEIVLTNWNVKESLEVTFGSYHIMTIGDMMVSSTPDQQFAIHTFTRWYGKCFMYINVPGREGKERALRI